MHSDEVLAFLEDHPDFLQQHAERFGLHASPPAHDRVVVSLADRQLLEVKDRNRQLEARLHQLIRHGEANDQIINSAHQMSLALQRCLKLQQVVDALASCFHQDFSLDRVALRLWHPAAESSPLYNARHEVQALARNLSAPYCGPYVNDEVLSWFPASPVLQSFSQIALCDASGTSFGLLVLASDDAQRFTFDMYTHYLAQLGELISAALLRVLGQA